MSVKTCLFVELKINNCVYVNTKYSPVNCVTITNNRRIAENLMSKQVINWGFSYKHVNIKFVNMQKINKSPNKRMVICRPTLRVLLTTPRTGCAFLWPNGGGNLRAICSTTISYSKIVQSRQKCLPICILR